MADDNISMIKRALPLSAYIGRHTELRRQGGQGKFRGPCPIHKGDNKSALSVDDSKAGGLWSCFHGCGGGSVIDFWMKLHDNDDLGAALEALASEVGITLKQREGGRHELPMRRLKEALRWVAEEANIHLLDEHDAESVAARDYLFEVRGMKESIAKTWQLGVLPEGEDAVDFIIQSTRDEDAAVEVGLLQRRQSDDALWCPMQGRLLFPICDKNGDVVGFGAREVPGVKAYGSGKYINSPESRVYQKSKILYGMDVLTRDTKRGVVVEGYLDVIAVSETRDAGVGLATCGTAMTPGHAELLKSLPEVVMLFDGDTAGRKALAGSFWVANKLGDKVKAAVLGGGSDNKVDPWDAHLSNPNDLLRMIDRADQLLPAAVRAKDSVKTSDSELDKWVAQAISALSRTDHKDAVVRAAADARQQAVGTYSRTLTTAAIKPSSHDEESEPLQRLDLNMQTLLKRILQMEDSERSSVLASLTRWNDVADGAVRTWLPVSSEVDIAAFGRVAVGGSSWDSSSGEVDRLLARLMVEGEEPEDISMPLRSIITLMHHDSREICGDGEAPVTLTQQLLALRRINGSSKDIASQPTVLAFLIDLAMDLERYRRLRERARARAAVE